MAPSEFVVEDDDVTLTKVDPVKTVGATLPPMHGGTMFALNDTVYIYGGLRHDLMSASSDLFQLRRKRGKGYVMEDLCCQEATGDVYELNELSLNCIDSWNGLVLSHFLKQS